MQLKQLALEPGSVKPHPGAVPSCLDQFQAYSGLGLDLLKKIDQI